MIVRFGYVAMSVELEKASPSKTMTMASFSKLQDREAGLRRLERIAEENLHNTLRLLKHNRYLGVHVYRMTSKLIPLATHEELADWDPFPILAPSFAEVGAFSRDHNMRVSFHPDHFTVISTPREDVLRKSINDLKYHVRMLEAMGLDGRATNNIHVGGSYGDKPTSSRRFIEQFRAIEPRITSRITLENDDKTFTALETLEIAEAVGTPMVLDIHHHAVNPGNEKAADLWPRILRTWNDFAWNVQHANTPLLLPPKIHASSPKSESDPRGHADNVEIEPLFRFLMEIAGSTPAIDVMIEAKRKDGALLQLMDDFRALEEAGEPIRIIDGGSMEVLS
ncbi:UV DNA damage repair endonuclease UvsE [Cohnella endophytica]|uniref:UV DNA damage repair endonuclease UvsE n=1 Tax=Cohnella endophytica TaxID=2419778 RepID=A0A494XMM4_9BACL|nr:UV DNA damage repair endonuclease UvsE [Cohnella endophytica]RKP48783.1 UV DNA damage repair endonuclease UvsE [Cohnella endophytica]